MEGQYQIQIQSKRKDKMKFIKKLIKNLKKKEDIRRPRVYSFESDDSIEEIIYVKKKCSITSVCSQKDMVRRNF